MLPDTVTQSPPNILAGLIPDEECARQLHCSIRTLDRYRAAGMPTIILGKKVLFDPSAVREWVLSHQRRHDAPKRGRPTKRAA